MKIIERKFKSDREGDWANNASGAFVCYDDIAEHFAIPRGTNAIWIALHDSPAKQRLAVRFQECPMRCKIVEAEDSSTWPLDYDLWNLLEARVSDLYCKTFYVEVNY